MDPTCVCKIGGDYLFLLCKSKTKKKLPSIMHLSVVIIFPLSFFFCVGGTIWVDPRAERYLHQA
jgi:hypothetical protein